MDCVPDQKTLKLFVFAETIKANIYFHSAGFNLEKLINPTSLREGKVVKFADYTKTEKED